MFWLSFVASSFSVALHLNPLSKKYLTIMKRVSCVSEIWTTWFLFHLYRVHQFYLLDFTLKPNFTSTQVAFKILIPSKVVKIGFFYKTKLSDTLCKRRREDNLILNTLFLSPFSPFFSGVCFWVQSLFYLHRYRAFHGFGQAKFAYGIFI